MKVRKSEDRGHVNHGWLDARHGFSFADYHDPKHMGFGPIRVMNEDRVQPKAGFGMHPHRDMEIITYVISGSLEHKDNMGNVGQIQAGEFQRMSAGTGIMHSEYNPSANEDTHLYQIWIKPREKNLPSDYEQRTLLSLPNEEGRTLVATATGRNNSMTIQQDVDLYHLLIKENEEKEIEVSNKGAWLQIVSGVLKVGDTVFEAGDALALEQDETITLQAKDEVEILFFDLY